MPLDKELKDLPVTRESIVEAIVGKGGAKRAAYVNGRFPDKASEVDGFVAEFAGTPTAVTRLRRQLEGLVH